VKKLVLLFYSIVTISCHQNTQHPSGNAQTRDNQYYATELISTGFLKYAESSKIDSLKTQLKNSFDIYEEDNFRIAQIDAEQLAEFSFGSFLPNLNRILAKRDFKLSAKRVNEDDKSFDILINTDTIQLYTQKELDNQTFWDAASRNFFRKVNEMLKANDSDEQFYLLYGGNDLNALLLTGKQFSIIADYYKNEPKETPYKP